VRRRLEIIPQVASCIAVVLLLPACVQPGTPIPEHRIRGLPEGFPCDFPLHVDFRVSGTPKKLPWSGGDYFVVKFITELRPHEIDYFFRKKLAVEHGYTLLAESGFPPGGGFLAFEKGARRVEITVGKEQGVTTILLRLKDAAQAPP
jgi:hypothetical protein